MGSKAQVDPLTSQVEVNIIVRAPYRRDGSSTYYYRSGKTAKKELKVGESRLVKCPRCSLKFTPREAYSRTAAREGAQKQYTKAFTSWSPEDDKLFFEMARAGKPVDEMSVVLQRQPSAIKVRIERLCPEVLAPPVLDGTADTEQKEDPPIPELDQLP